MKWWLLSALLLLKAVGLGLVFATGWDPLGWALFSAGSLIVVSHHFCPRFQGLCDVVTKIPAKGRQVWLTIDDGPDPEDTPKILDLLDQHGAKATFFMTGKRAESFPGLVREVVGRGHGVGCHTYSHPMRDFWCAGRARVCRELDDSLSVLRGAGADVRFFRAPVGIKNLFLSRCLRERDLRCVAWSVRSADGVSKRVEAVVERVMREVRPGSILLMHEGPTVAPGVRVEGLRGVLRGLSERGFSCVLPTGDRRPGAEEEGGKSGVSRPEDFLSRCHRPFGAQGVVGRATHRKVMDCHVVPPCDHIGCGRVVYPLSQGAGSLKVGL